MTQNHYQVSVSEVLFLARPPRGRRGAPGETPLRFVGLDPTAVHPTNATAPRGWRPRGAGLGLRTSPSGLHPRRHASPRRCQAEASIIRGDCRSFNIYIYIYIYIYIEDPTVARTYSHCSS